MRCVDRILAAYGGSAAFVNSVIADESDNGARDGRGGRAGRFHHGFPGWNGFHGLLRARSRLHAQRARSIFLCENLGNDSRRNLTGVPSKRSSSGLVEDGGI